MQHVLNTNERNQAFFQFLLFFLLTIVLVIGAVYFNFFGVPEKEKHFYKEQVSEQRTEDSKQHEFLYRMNQAKTLLDSIDKSGTDVGEVEQQLNKELNALSNFRANDSIYIQFNGAITEAFRELKKTKKERIDLLKKAADYDKINAELTTVKEERDRCLGLLNTQDKPAFEDIQ